MRSVIRKSEVFKNAAKMLRDDSVRVVYENETKAVFSVVDPRSLKEHFVNIYYDEDAKVIKATCSCTLQSLKSKHLPLCSHIMASTNKLIIE